MRPCILLRILGPVLLAACGATQASAQNALAKLEIVSGDRQIAVNTRTPPQPYVVRAVDAAGMPVEGVTLVIQTSGGGDGAFLRDEFGFRGFNTPQNFLPNPTGIFPEYLAVTGADGLASASGHYVDSPPSAFLVAATGPRPSSVPPIFFFTVWITAPPPGNPSLIVEYFDADLGHYFNTLYQVEIDALDAGRFPGWNRSIGSFIGWASAQDAPAGTVPVCRFFSALYTAHFYTADVDECNAVIATWPDVWTLETRAAFYIFLPDKATGACGAGMQPVYRLYDTRNGPNHRYVTDRKLRDTMRNSGWIPEGYGPDAVIMCTPA